MSQFVSSNRKIDPSRYRTSETLSLKPDGSPNDPDRVEIGPTERAFKEWHSLGLSVPNLERMREFRLQRITHELNKRNLGGVLLFDPLNIRYATDSTNMQVWIAHNPSSRAAFVSADGYVILWEFSRCEFLSAHLHRINEFRTGTNFIYFTAGDLEHENARKFAAEIYDVVQEHCRGNQSLSIDRIEASALYELERLGITCEQSMEVMEHARVIKGEEDIKAMRCAIASCEIAMKEMYSALVPGIAETELWSVLHKENIARGGEWIECRLLSSGPRTNPWMQEAGPRCIQNGELLGFDTDLVGPYGICADISRTWYCGEGKANDSQRRLYEIAVTHVEENMHSLAPGVSFKELTFGGHMLPEEFVPQRYCVKMHGVGLCDEYPTVAYPEDYVPGGFEGYLEPGMVICVEAYIGAVGGKDGVKLEEQVLITETGYEKLSSYPYDENLL